MFEEEFFREVAIRKSFVPAGFHRGAIREHTMSLRQLLLMACLLVMGRVLAAEYYVTPTGNDFNTGTKAQPWATLEKAATAGAGDTVYLGAGTYREVLRPGKSGEAGKPVRFVALPREKVVLSGAEPLAGAWQQHQGNIYKLQTKLKFIQLFVDGKMIVVAFGYILNGNAAHPNKRATEISENPAPCA